MSVTKDDVRKVARLSRIAVDETRLEGLAGELNGILGWIEQLNEVDVEGVEPMTSTSPSCSIQPRIPFKSSAIG